MPNHLFVLTYPNMENELILFTVPTIKKANVITAIVSY
jgi:hypothetical protein